MLYLPFDNFIILVYISRFWSHFLQPNLPAFDSFIVTMILPWKKRRPNNMKKKNNKHICDDLDVEVIIPTHFRCPISLDLMKDPVTLCTGITYDRESIERWIQAGNETCPVTKQVLKTFDQIPNHMLRRMIQDWCVQNRSHGVERIPTPRIPVSPYEVSEICSRIATATQLGDGNKCVELVRKIKNWGKESERNKRCVVENGTGCILLASFEAFACVSFEKHLNLLVEILSVLSWMFPFGEEGRSKLGYEPSLRCIIWFLRNGDLSARQNAVLVLKEILYSDERHVITNTLLNIEGVVEALFYLIREPISPTATKASMTAIYYMISSTVKNDKISSRFLEMGLVGVIVEAIVEAEKSVCEKALGVLDAICNTEQGKEEAYPRLHSLRRIQTHGDETPKGFSALPMNNAGSNAVEGKIVGDHVDERTRAQLCKIMKASECNLLPQSQRGDANACLGQHRGEEVACPIGEVELVAGFSNTMQPCVQPTSVVKTNNGRSALDVRDIHDLLSQPSLSMAFGGPSGNPNFVLPFSSGLADGNEQSKTSSSFQQGQQSRPILPKPSKIGPATSSELNKSAVPQARIARPPVEGRGKNHLLPRYWPKITDQELQKLSGDLKSTIVPLFEKVLSASDAGRIGRLVLPKACAEAYFPPISQSEGLPLRIQDVKGKEWTFQFRFWPNNNSRMYVLEGVTPCIQSMQLRAGDTVTFSRIDPGGKLVMGFRKATNSDTKKGLTSSLPNGAHSGETSQSGGIENLSTVSAYSGLLPTPKGGMDPLVIALSERLCLPDVNIRWVRGENHGDGANEDPVQQPAVNAEKKKTRNIGSKSKRLLMHSEDALELRFTWEEAQDLLRPPPSVTPSIVTIEDHEFEEYDEPPVFGKRTIFAARPSGGQEQWAQCDDCSKWRRLPIDVLLPPKWRCSDNVWDSSRCSCFAPEDSSPKELENLLKADRDMKKRKIPESPKLDPEPESSGLDALASAAVLGDKMGDVGESSVGATTKHPRHRPGCTCIVCIQPPSGKGKHKPTCTCNVCMTVKRRFKTLMLRKKKRQLEREAEISQNDNNEHKDESELNDTRHDHSENEGRQSRILAEVAETSGGDIDLNCHPNREDVQLEEAGLNMMNLVKAGSMLVENYVEKNGIGSLMSEQQGSLSHHLLTEASRENERHLSDEEFLASVGWVGDKKSDEVHKKSSMDRNGLQ